MSILVLAPVIVVSAFLLGREARRVLFFANNSWQEDHMADCAVVLTGGAGRVREGFDMLAHRSIKKLIISGVNPQAKLREIFPQWPFYGEVKEQDVILERRSRTTFGNVQQTLPLVEALGCRDLVVITSTLHMHRALKTFQGAFPEDFPVYGRAVQTAPLHPVSFDFAVEVAKSVFYSLWAY
jgi:uncharacterized SAM-binding protein YcdF (DUF218 family)